MKCLVLKSSAELELRELQNMKLKINGREYEIVSGPGTTLLDVLRYELRLTGTKEGCGTGSCGSCTVLVDGKAINSCLVIVGEVEGKEITTIEGLSRQGKLHPLQQAFINEGAVQCGFCTPGILLTAKAFLDSNSHPTESQIRQAIAGNLCRCTGYDKIVRAIMSVADS
ncbi:MAG: (2Fe-2S)-binding protein [Dehalococcoidales bacterium]|nr:(2Fe-2S)-binding protein [Dehalococcoidales bacterium]